MEEFQHPQIAIAALVVLAVLLLWIFLGFPGQETASRKRWFFLTAAERAQLAEDKEIKRECKFFLNSFPDWLATFGIAHWTTKNESEFRIRQKVKFIRAKFNSDAIYLQVDVRNMPWPHKPFELHTPEMLEALTLAAGRQVTWENTAPENGAFFVVARNGAVGAIPREYSFRAALKLLTEKEAPLEFVVGAAKNKRSSHIDLTKAPHYLIAGATFTGKSVHINSMLCQLISRNRPETLQLLLIDMKGTEFSLYEGLPHLWRQIVTKLEDVTPALDEIHKEIRRRNTLFTQAGVKTLEGYNESHPHNPLPYIVVVIDELAEILKSFDREVAKSGENILGRTIMVARSAGIHYVLSTQRPSGEVIPAWIKAQASIRIAFAMASIHDSMVVIDCADAKGLKPAGRAVYQAGPERVEVQSPFISDEQIRRIVKHAREADLPPGEELPHEIGLQELLNEAVDNYHGELKEKPLYNSFRGQIGRDKIRELLRSLNGEPVSVYGKLYQVVNRKWGPVTTRMLEEIPRSIEPLPALSPKLSHELFPRGRGRGSNPQN